MEVNIRLIEEVKAPNMTEVPHSEEPVMSSSSRDSSSSGSESDTTAQEEGSEAMDLRESSRSYVFGPSTVTVGRVRKMASLGYFTEGTAWEPREEVVPEPVDDKVVVFKEIFAAGLRMSPPPALADILHKFWVQLHQLTPKLLLNYPSTFGRS
jgi:hypothetical protein